MNQFIKKVLFMYQNWKLATHFIFRTKRFGVNNKWWNDFDSMWGLPWYKQLVHMILIKPMIREYKQMKFRAVACHCMTDEEKAKMGWLKRKKR